MPPEKKKQPEQAEKADFLDDLALTMVTAGKVLSDSGGKITMRRLNKRDYQNSIESLLGVRLSKELLPDDGDSGDFDTVGASLFLTSDKFEQYLKIGRHAIDEFFQRRAARSAKPFVYRVEPEETLNVAQRERVERNDEYLKRHAALMRNCRKPSLYLKTRALRPSLVCEVGGNNSIVNWTSTQTS